MVSTIFHRSLTKAYPTANGSSGVYIYSADGKKVLDGSSGAAVSALGHGNHEVLSVITDQAQRLVYAHTSFFTSEPAEELSDFLVEESKGAFSRAMFFNSGSEAVESALKLSRQYHVMRGELDRTNIIGRQYSYHGNTLGALAAGFNPIRRDIFSPMLGQGFHHVNCCSYPRFAEELTEDAYEDLLLGEYALLFDQLGSHTIAAVIVETIGGATLGCVLPTPHYLSRLKDLCSTNGVLLIYDEVMCGMGRSGSFHAWQALGAPSPDIQTIGKGLGAGYQPISAVLISPHVVETFEDESHHQTFVSGHTYQGHSMGCAAALAVQKIIKRDSLLENVRRMGSLLVSRLKQGVPAHIKVEIRGMGLFQALDFETTGQDYGGPLAGEVTKECFANGAAVYLCSPAVAAVMFAPPFISTAREVEELVRIFLTSLKDVLARRVKSKKVPNNSGLPYLDS